MAIDSSSAPIDTAASSSSSSLPSSATSATAAANAPAKPIGATDPGVRSFSGIASSNGDFWKWGDGLWFVVLRWAYRIDKLQSYSDTYLQGHHNKKKRRNVKKLMNRMRRKIVNMMTDFHRKLARFIVQTFAVFFIPVFRVSEMTIGYNDEGVKRKISKKTTRMLLSLRHYSFRTWLQQTAKGTDCKVIVCTEEYTSKTCGK
jgi:putative transposase